MKPNPLSRFLSHSPLVCLRRRPLAFLIRGGGRGESQEGEVGGGIKHSHELLSPAPCARINLHV
jgi:hypothetical protein